MGHVERALELSQRGFSVFPVRAYQKSPPLIKGWPELSTTDEQTIRKWWAEWPEANIGLDVGKSGLVVLDVDTKGKNGPETLLRLELENGDLPETLQARTPSGGTHYFFATEELIDNSVERLGAGLDIRGRKGYVVAPGSKTADGEYEWTQNSLSPAQAPEWLISQARRKVQKTQEAAKISINEAQAEHMVRALTWLVQTAPPAIEGKGGDLTTYRVACECRDYGLNLDKTLFFMLELYNPRCVPPWSKKELYRKVKNAFDYAQSPPGAKIPDFEPLADATSLPQGRVKFEDVEKREWVLGHRYMRETVTVTIAPGGAGKSMLTYLEALAIATGRPLTGITPRVSGPVYIYNTEESRAEIVRRITAAAVYHEIPEEEIYKNVRIASGQDMQLMLAVEDPKVRLTNHVQLLEDAIKENNYVAVFIDPLISAHSVNENDNNAIQTVVHALARLAMRTKVAIGLVHHSRKGFVTGDMDAARGASALIAAARIASTVSGMTKAESQSLRLTESERLRHIRVDSAKGNYALPSMKAEWYRKASITLATGDSVGVLEVSDLSGRLAQIDKQIQAEQYQVSDEIEDELAKDSMTLNRVAAYLQEQAPAMYAGFSKTYVMDRIEEIFAYPGYSLGSGRRIEYVYEKRGNGSRWLEIQKEQTDD